MKTKKRSFVIGITTLSLVMLLLVTFTITYLTDHRNTLNVMGIGVGDNSDTDSNGNPKQTVRIALTEEKFAEYALANGGTAEIMTNALGEEYEKVELYNIVPGEKINKDSTVKNEGLDKVWVRVKLSDENGADIDLTAAPYSILGAQVNPDFVKHADGYYYYETALDVGATIPVFVNKGTDADPYTFMIPAGTNNTEMADLIGVLNLNVTADAIQFKAFTPDFTQEAPWIGEDGNPVPNEDIIPAKY